MRSFGRTALECILILAGPCAAILGSEHTEPATPPTGHEAPSDSVSNDQPAAGAEEAIQEEIPPGGESPAPVETPVEAEIPESPSATAPVGAGEPAGPKPAAPEESKTKTLPIIGQRDVELRYHVEERGAAGISSLIVHTTQDHGRTWSSWEHKGGDPSVIFRTPRDGRYGFRLTAVDTVGARGAAPASGDRPELEVVIDTTPPVIRVIRPDRLDTVPPDGRVEIAWDVTDENLGPAPLEVAASHDGGPWETIWEKAPGQGSRPWNVPLLAGDVRLRFRARDLGGHQAEIITPGVWRISPGDRTIARWVTVPSFSRTRRVPVYYRLVREAEAGSETVPSEETRKVELFWRTDGLEWVSGGTDPDRRSPLFFDAPRDGWFELFLASMDRQGRPIPSTTVLGPGGRPDLSAQPHARCLVDTQEPRVTILEPANGAWIEAGSELLVRYGVQEENVRAKPVTILSSLDGGTTWSLLAEGLEPTPEDDNGIQATGEFRFRLPSIDSEKFLLKVQAVDAADNVGEVITDPLRPMTIRNLRDDQGRKAQEYYHRGLVLLRSADPGDRPRAVESLRRALAYQPDLASAHHDLAVVLESLAPEGGMTPLGGAGDEALLHWRKAHNLVTEDPRYSFSLVEALLRRWELRKGDDKEALFKEAESVFQSISWTRIAEMASEDKNESQRLRSRYKEWKVRYFNRLRS